MFVAPAAMLLLQRVPPGPVAPLLLPAGRVWPLVLPPVPPSPCLSPGVPGRGAAGTEVFAAVEVQSLLWAGLAAPLLGSGVCDLPLAVAVPPLLWWLPGVGTRVAVVPGSVVASRLPAGWVVGWATVHVAYVAGLGLEARPVRVLAACVVVGRTSLRGLLRAAVCPPVCCGPAVGCSPGAAWWSAAAPPVGWAERCSVGCCRWPRLYVCARRSAPCSAAGVLLGGSVGLRVPACTSCRATPKKSSKSAPCAIGFLWLPAELEH